MSVKTITILFLIIWFSLTISIVSHELWHMFQFKTQDSDITETCFLGYKKDNGWHKNFYAIGWVWSKNPYARITEWDAWYIGIGIAIISALGLTEMLFTRQKPMCFGTKEFKQTSNICLGCELRTECRREHLNNHRMVRY